MGRLKGFGSAIVITGVVVAGLRGVHLLIPTVFPSTRLAPVTVTGFDDVRRLTGFAPVLPAYRPATLGAAPAFMRVAFSPRPTLAIRWSAGEHFLDVTEWQGGREPERPPLSQPLRDVADSFWWTDGPVSHLVVSREGLWIHLVTSLPESELRRFADTLARP
jgi:hypothetical protein